MADTTTTPTTRTTTTPTTTTPTTTTPTTTTPTTTTPTTTPTTTTKPTTATITPTATGAQDTTTEGNLPGLSIAGTLPALVTTQSWTTPAVSVPPSVGNPYIYLTSRINGTVFIAVGAVVGAILLAFVGFHVVRSLWASKTAKRTLAKEMAFFENYNQKSEYQRLKGDTNSPSNPNAHYADASVGDFSSVYNSSQVGSVGAALPAVKTDVTRMFVSPTADIMNHKRGIRPNGTNTSPSVGGFSNNRNSFMPSIYMDDDMTESAPSIAPMSTVSQGINQAYASPRKNNPSMYLDDLLQK